MGFSLLLVDDHALFRAGLRSLLTVHCPDAVLAEAGDGAAAISAAAERKPDLVILDLNLPDQNGLEVARQIVVHSPGSRIIILSADSDLYYVKEALEIGVLGYLLKTNAPEELLRAISAVLAGKIFLSPVANAAVLEDYRQTLVASNKGRMPLSDREKEVLCCIVDGVRVKEIAERLKVGVRTVETYRQRLMKKVACGSTAELVRYALREGIIHSQ